MVPRANVTWKWGGRNGGQIGGQNGRRNAGQNGWGRNAPLQNYVDGKIGASILTFISTSTLTSNFSPHTIIFGRPIGHPN